MSDDERVQQVIDELDPTPAHEVAWPVSRRQTLRALAAAGVLGSGSGSASAESVGGVIADEAVLSNYGSESVSDGWELTIDDDVFGLTESDEETIELPDGGVGEEVIMPDGVEAGEIVAPDGTVVFAIPDSDVVYDAIESFDPADDGTTINSWNDYQQLQPDLTGGDPTIDDDGIGDVSLLFDSVDDALTASSSEWTTLTQPITAYVVIDPASDFDDTVSQNVTGRESSGDGRTGTVEWRENATWQLFGGTALEGSSTVQRNLITGVFDGADSIIREDGTETGSGDAGSEDWESLSLGALDGNRNHFDGHIAALYIQDERASSSKIADTESIIDSRWNLGLGL